MVNGAQESAFYKCPRWFLGIIKFESHWSVLVVGQLELDNKVDNRYVACSQYLERQIICSNYLRENRKHEMYILRFGTGDSPKEGAANKSGVFVGKILQEWWCIFIS